MALLKAKEVYNAFKNDIGNLVNKYDKDSISKMAEIEFYFYYFSVYMKPGYYKHPRRFIVFFSKQHKIAQTEFNRELYNLDRLNAKINSFSINEYNSTFFMYFSLPEDVRLFNYNKINDTLERTPVFNSMVYRIEAYKCWIEEPVEIPIEVVKKYNCNFEYSFEYDDNIYILNKEYVIPEYVKNSSINIATKKGTNDYIFDFERIPELSREMDEKIKEYNLKNSFEPVREGHYSTRPIPKIRKNENFELVSDTILSIKGMCHLLGLVGSGKSTLRDILTYDAAQKGYRVSIITSRVDETYNLVQMFKAMGIKTAGISGMSLDAQKRHYSHLMHDGDEWLESQYDVNLTGYCLLDAFKKIDKTPSFVNGKEPCYSFFRAKKKGGKEDSRQDTNTLCPYYAVCTRKKNSRDVISSSVLVTNVHNYVSSKTPVLFSESGMYRISLLDYIMDNFDIVIFDEADALQNTLDEKLLNCESVDDLQDFLEDYRNITVEKKLKNMEMFEEEFMDSKHILNKIFINVYRKIDKEVIKNMINNMPFSTLSLIDKIKSETVKSALREYCFTHNENEFFNEFFNSDCNNIIPVTEHYGITDSDDTDRISFTLMSLHLERTLFNVINSYNKNRSCYKKNIEELDALRNPFRVIQKYLPMAPMNNVFSFSYDNDTKKLTIFRKYGVGRFLMTDFSNIRLKIDDKGNVVYGGPNVILMSGSSYIPKSLPMHVANEVNYVLESPKKTKELLAKTKVYVANIETKISGSSNKIKALKDCLDEIKDSYLKKALKENKHILMLCNSYEQCKIVGNTLKNIIPDEKVMFLVPDITKNVTEDMLTFSNLAIFRRYNAKILVAPSIIAGRGHNILDENGNSLFTAIMFLVRELAPPGDIKDIVAETNGILYNVIYDNKDNNLLDRLWIASKEVHKFWYNRFNKYHGLSYLKKLNSELYMSILATMWVNLQQESGRGFRVSEFGEPKKPLDIYFIDAAYTGSGKEDSLDILSDLKDYCRQNLAGKNGYLFKELYGVLFNALIEA